jgi:hypothetical protein
MPRLNEMYPSKWMSAKDLDGQDKVVTIRRIEEETIAQDDKWVLYFDLRQSTKGLVLNQTNAKTIAKLYGEDSDEWIGKSITLFPTEVDFKGDQVEAIRIRSKAPVLGRKPQPVPAQPAPMTQADVDADDEIPF